MKTCDAKPRPFLKWAGGKTQLLLELRKRIPASWNPERDWYFEPFVGAGALFWDLQPKHAVLNDLNGELMNVWRVLQLSIETCISELKSVAAAYRVDAEKIYYYWRNVRIWGSSSSVQLAARTIFLNKTCFNGLYRVNSEGNFNVPWGRSLKRTICDEENLHACAKFLSENEIQTYNEDFNVHFQDASAKYGDNGLRGALIYFDPPYIPTSKTSNFTSYTAGGFSYANQLRLVALASDLRDLGAHVMLSQAADEPLIDQYRRVGFTCDLIEARRAINSKVGKRGPVGEYIIH